MAQGTAHRERFLRQRLPHLVPQRAEAGAFPLQAARWPDCARTARSSRSRRWTSDCVMAWRDKEGYLYLSGRKKDMIIRGGENICPIEIEDVLGRCPGVRGVAVVGVPDDHWGEVAHARHPRVRCRPGRERRPGVLPRPARRVQGARDVPRRARPPPQRRRQGPQADPACGLGWGRQPRCPYREGVRSGVAAPRQRRTATKAAAKPAAPASDIARRRMERRQAGGRRSDARREGILAGAGRVFTRLG